MYYLCTRHCLNVLHALLLFKKIHNNYSCHFIKEDIEPRFENYDYQEAGSGEPSFELEVLRGSPMLEGFHCYPVQMPQLLSLKAQGRLQRQRNGHRSFKMSTSPRAHCLSIPCRRLTN